MGQPPTASCIADADLDATRVADPSYDSDMITTAVGLRDLLGEVTCEVIGEVALAKWPGARADNDHIVILLVTLKASPGPSRVGRVASACVAHRGPTGGAALRLRAAPCDARRGLRCLRCRRARLRPAARGRCQGLLVTPPVGHSASALVSEGRPIAGAMRARVGRRAWSEGSRHTFRRSPPRSPRAGSRRWPRRRSASGC